MFKVLFLRLLLILTIVLISTCASAQQTAYICTQTINTNGGTNCIPVSSSNPFPIAVFGGTNGQCFVSNGTKGIFTTCPGGGGSGTVTSITAGTGLSASPASITTTGSLSLLNATTTSLGGIIAGSGLAISTTGVLSTSGGSGTVTSITAGSSNIVVNPSSLTTTGTIDLSANPTVATLNKIIFTQPATAATLTIANNKTLTDSNTLTFTGTDGSSVNFGTGGTVLYANQSIALSGDVTGSGTTAITTTVSKIAGTTVSGTTGTGNVVFSAAPTLTGQLSGADASLSGTTTVNNITITGTCTGCGSAGATSLSSLTSGTATNSIDNTNKVQTWAWGTLSTETAFTVTTSSATTGIGFQATNAGPSNTGYAGFFTNSSTSTGWAIGTAGSINIGNGNYRIGNVNAVRIPDNTLDVTSIGVGPTALAAYATTTGNNVAIGLSALTSSTTGVQNTCGGSGSCAKILTDSGNTAWGYQALANMAIGNTTSTGGNTAIGFQALASSTTSFENTAVGYQAMSGITGGASTNTVVGYKASAGTTGNTTVGANAGTGGGASNVSIGNNANSGTTGNQNVYIGSQVQSGVFSASAANDVFIGFNININGSASNDVIIGAGNVTALSNSTSAVGVGVGAKPGSNDVAIGAQALAGTTTNANQNVGIGFKAGALITTGANNTVIGANVGSTVLTTGSSNILIGTSSATTVVSAGDSSKLNIGNLIFNDLAGTSAPTISPCGTSPTVDTHANNYSGTVTVGSVSATSCTITFAHAYTTWNHCRVTAQTTLAGLAYSYTTAAITVSATGLTGDLIDYQCDGY